MGPTIRMGAKKDFGRLPSHTNDVPVTISGCSPNADYKWPILKYCDLCAGGNTILKRRIVFLFCRVVIYEDKQGVMHYFGLKGIIWKRWVIFDAHVHNLIIISTCHSF